MTARFQCCEQNRLEVIKLHGPDTVNGIEFLEVLDKGSPAGAPRQQTLMVRLLRPNLELDPTKYFLTPDNLRISGGERIPVKVVWCAAANALPPQAEPGLDAKTDDKARTLVIRTDSGGDHSIYQLAVVASSGSDDPHPSFDARLSTIEFSFKVECPSDFDCKRTPVCPIEGRIRPAIDYLTKDYQGFRRLMLDRMSLLVPGWTERSPADVGVILVELLAYAADNLSYRQDVIANEAYLGTARQRISVRRHARLVDYLMHEGCNARAFVYFEIQGSNVTLERGTQLLTYRPGLDTVVNPAGDDVDNAIRAGSLVFETVHKAELSEQQNELYFYTWGDEACCLPRGATRATLTGLHPELKAGNILLFEEVISPTTLTKEDADRSHRWAVRLTKVMPSEDPSAGLFNNPPDNSVIKVAEIEWDAADALPFPLCISVAKDPDAVISVARGNIVLADHGRSITDETFDHVPKASVEIARNAPSGTCVQPDRQHAPARFRPALKKAPLTHGFDLDGMLSVPIADDELWWPASSMLIIAARQATPIISRLAGELNSVTEFWTPRRDLLESRADATDFTVEIEDDGTARLRFGDGDEDGNGGNGKRPAENTEFKISYRVGNGAVGNVGAEAIRHVVLPAPGAIKHVRNPMAAAGGVDPEDIEVVRRDAPEAFRTQERAVTPADYAAAAERQIDVQRAAATFRWTGSWHTVFVSADRYGGLAVDRRISTKLRSNLERVRMAGYDLEVYNPRYVPLEVELHVCVNPGYFRADVLQAVQKKLSSDMLPDGTLGIFHPDNFTFGQPVYLSPIVAAAQAVEGVDAVRPEVFRRMFGASPTSLIDGVIPIGGMEIGQLAQNPNFRERGTLKIHSGGGK
jgi:hypothetical protein